MSVLTRAPLSDLPYYPSAIYPLLCMLGGFVCRASPLPDASRIPAVPKRLCHSLLQ